MDNHPASDINPSRPEAIILAGGLGTRLRSAVPDLPKCMATVNGHPFLAYVIGSLTRQGISRFIFSLGYRHESIEQYLQAEFTGLDYQCVVETEPLGTGGAIRLAAQSATTDTVLVLNGDTLFSVKLEPLLAFHHVCGADCTLALKPMKQFSRYGVVELNNDYSIRNFREKQYYDQGLINGGIYALNRNHFLRENWPEKFSFERDYLEKGVSRRRLFGVVQDGYFIDIGIPEDLQRATMELSHPGDIF